MTRRSPIRIFDASYVISLHGRGRERSEPTDPAGSRGSDHTTRTTSEPPRSPLPVTKPNRTPFAHLLPPRPLVGRSLTKTVFLWGFIRAVLATFGVSGFSPWTTAGVLAVILALVHTDIALLRERLLLENLGVGRATLFRFAAAVVVLLECSLVIAMSARR